jgi:CDP-paratose 2-epimerase
MRILITGGAGFVGGELARHFRRASAANSVVVLDNLRRRGSEWNLAELRREGIDFVHGDVRQVADLAAVEGNFDVLIEASAEPSVAAGLGGSPRYVLDTNLSGAINCLEFARERCAGAVFLSTSRVYSIAPLLALPLQASATRLDLPEPFSGPGIGHAGITEAFPHDSQRSYYGASKLAAELLCQEYSAHAGLPVVINRCGVIAGPGQFGRTDQGVFTLWVARHHFGRDLKYTGFGGRGLQVRDLLHPADLCDLVSLQVAALDDLGGQVFNVGGGRAGSVSLCEYTALCREATGQAVPIAQDPSTHPVDIPWYITDHARISSALAWQPRRGPARIVEDIAAWVREHANTLASIIH